MNKVYLVYKDNGEEYEDYSEWVEYVTSTLDKADQLLVKYGYTKENDMKNTYVTYVNNEYYDDVKTYAWIVEKNLIQ